MYKQMHYMVVSFDLPINMKKTISINLLMTDVLETSRASQLQSKPTGWFLYDENIGRKKVNDFCVDTNMIWSNLSKVTVIPRSCEYLYLSGHTAVKFWRSYPEIKKNCDLI